MMKKEEEINRASRLSPPHTAACRPTPLPGSTPPIRYTTGSRRSAARTRRGTIGSSSRSRPDFSQARPPRSPSNLRRGLFQRSPRRHRSISNQRLSRRRVQCSVVYRYPDSETFWKIPRRVEGGCDGDRRFLFGFGGDRAFCGRVP
ncbi:hypothetical protein C1H46_024063 [Malus baccata]|uniref:Uncharacterized protein n=1 Tax=Malus baccata TaxID=106549 RepID=A0A540LV40_MALBA|nr:hypothetical protein C1H46_024063 [Malus baccata]